MGSLTSKQIYKQTVKGRAAATRYKKGAAGRAAAKRARMKLSSSYNRDAMRKWRSDPANRERERARKQTPEAKLKALIGYLRRQHGLMLEDYYRKLHAQSGHCALCLKTPEQEYHNRLNVDHDHTKAPGDPAYFRGLLCTAHNVALGNLGDTEEGLARALAYVRGCL
jgi:hypothetical protein